MVGREPPLRSRATHASIGPFGPLASPDCNNSVRVVNSPLRSGSVRAGQAGTISLNRSSPNLLSQGKHRRCCRIRRDVSIATRPSRRAHARRALGRAAASEPLAQLQGDIMAHTGDSPVALVVEEDEAARDLATALIEETDLDVIA